MKKILLAFLFVVGLSSFASASENNFGVEYQWKQYKGTNASANQVQVNVQHIFDNKFGVDALFQGQQQYQAKDIDGRLEAGISYSTKVVGSVSVGVRGGVGNQFTTVKNYVVYNVTPAVSLELTPKISLNGSFKYENSFETDKYKVELQEWVVGPTYKVNDKNMVGVSYFRDNLTEQSQGVKVGYTLAF